MSRTESRLPGEPSPAPAPVRRAQPPRRVPPPAAAPLVVPGRPRRGRYVPELNDPSPSGGPGRNAYPPHEVDLPTEVPALPRDVASEPLTVREAQVLQLVAAGHSNKGIGGELYLSEDTIKTHMRRLMRKLKARDRAHAVAIGYRAGIIT